MPEIRYDEHGRARPVVNLADAAIAFDGDWDADLRALDTPKVDSMADWLIDPSMPPTSKLEGLQSGGGTLEGTWAPPFAPAVPAVGSTTTVNFEALLDDRPKLRKAARWLGLPVATHKVTTIPVVVSGATQVDGVLTMGYNATGPAVTTTRAVTTDWPRVQHMLACAFVWAMLAVACTTILRSLLGG